MNLIIELLLKSTPIRPYFYITPCLSEQPGRVQFQSVPIDTSLSTDAYDFNTDFK